MNAQLIDDYAGGGEKLARAIAGMGEGDLRATPVPGKWSTHTVVIHLCDAELAFADRIRRIIAMENPALLVWHENEFAANLHYHDQSCEDALALVQLTRRQIARVLRKLPESAFARTGTHSQRGVQTLEAVIGFANWHLDHHLKFIAEKREALVARC
jgi:hypothetical protein